MKLLNKDEFIANEIKFYFIKNNVEEGDKLPSEREMSEKFGVQRATVRSAYKILEEEGIIEICERRGRFMGHPRIVNHLDGIQSFSDKLNDMGLTTENKLISFELTEVDKELCKKIRLPIGTSVYKITRVRKAITSHEVVPVAIEYSYIPEEVAPKLIKYDLEECSLFDLLINKYDQVPNSEEQSIEVVYANDFESKNLNVDTMTALVKKNGITYDKDKKVIQYLHSVMNKEWVMFEETDPVIKDKMREGLYGL